MKSLNLKYTFEPKNKQLPYYVFLNRENKLFFSSKRKASDFIRLFESNTNDCLRSLNLIMSDLYKTYLDFYFHLDTITCERIKNEVDDYNTRIAYFFKNYDLGNQSFKLTAFYCLFDIVDNIITIINIYSKSAKNYQLVNCLNSHLKTISLLLSHFKELLNNYNNTKKYKTKVLTISYKKSISLSV